MSTSLAAPIQVGSVMVLPPTDASPDEAALATYNPTTVGQGLTFYQQFGPDAQGILAQVAEQQITGWVANPSSIIEFGNDVLEEVMAATQAIMKFTEGVKLPADDENALRDLKVQLDKAGGYDMTVAANIARYREMKAKLTARFGKGKARAWFAAFQADRQTLEQLTNEMGGDFVARAKYRGLAANQTHELFKANRESLGNLKERIAVIEMARQLVERERAKLPAVISPTDPLADKAAGMDMVIRMLDLKATNLANRWYVGMGLDPMLRAQQEQQIMMSMKLRDVGTVGMEKIRLILAQYAMSLDLQRDADSIAAFDQMDNELTQRMFKQTHATLGQVAGITTRSGTTVETISVIANEVTGMLTDVEKAYAESRAANAAQMQAITAGVKVMEAAQDKPVDTALVGAVVGEARRTKSLLG